VKKSQIRLDDGDDHNDPRLARFRAAVDVVAGTAPNLPPGALYVERMRALELDRHEEIERRRRVRRSTS
jgi:hypothetical protein